MPLGVNEKSKLVTAVNDSFMGKFFKNLKKWDDSLLYYKTEFQVLWNSYKNTLLHNVSRLTRESYGKNAYFAYS